MEFSSSYINENILAFFLDGIKRLLSIRHILLQVSLSRERGKSPVEAPSKIYEGSGIFWQDQAWLPHHTCKHWATAHYTGPLHTISHRPRSDVSSLPIYLRLS